MQSQIVDIRMYSYNFPDKIYCEIKRDNLIDSLEEMATVNDVVFVTGNSGMGKTVLLKQFCEKFNAISLFISPTNSNSMSIDLALMSLIEQIEFLMRKKNDVELPESIQKLKIKYGTSIAALSKFARQNQTVYIVLDGLYHSTIEDNLFIENLMELIPLGKKNIKIIISNTEENNILDDWVYENRSSKKDFSMVGLTENEVEKIFSEYKLEASEIEDIRSAFKGKPSDITELKYVLENTSNSRNDVQELIADVKGDIFNYLWSKSNFDENELRILAYVIYSKKEVKITDLEEILNLEQEHLKEKIDSIMFLSLNENIIKIRNESYIKGIENKVNYLKKETYDDLAQYILNNEIKKDYWLLATYFEQAENYEDLFSMLDDHNLVSSIVQSSSLSSLKMLVNSGLKISTQAENIPNIFKYSLANSVVRSNKKNDKKVEIEALMLTNQEDKALSFARNSNILEDKILGLSIIARNQKENRGVPDLQIVSEIKSLYENLDLRYIREKGIEIASELITVDVDMSIELLEKSFNLEKEGNSLDKIMLALSMDALNSRKLDSDNAFIESVKEKMKSPDLKDAFSTMFNFSKSIPEKYLLDEISKISSLDARIVFLANWCEENDAKNYRLNILEYAFDIIGSHSEYKSNLGVYYKLSEQLKLEKDFYKEFVELFDSRDEIFRENGSNVLYIRLLLNVLSLLDKFDKLETANRLDHLYAYVEKIEDISTKLECKCYMLVACKDFLNKNYLEDELAIVATLHSEIQTELKEITSNFAYQEELLTKPLEILAISDFSFCFEIVQTVNTIINKEKLYESIIKGLINNGIINQSTTENISDIIEKILHLLEKISYDINYYDDGLENTLNALNYLNSNDNKNLDIRNSTYFKLLNSINRIRESTKKLRCLAVLLNIFREKPFVNVAQLQDNIIQNWESINILPRKNIVGYELTKILANNNYDLAVNLSTKVLDEKKKQNQFESDEFWTVVFSLRILIHSLQGVDSRDTLNINQYIDRIRKLIYTLESSGEKAVLYSQLLIALTRSEINTPIKDLVLNITDEIDSISDNDERYKSSVLRRCAPALFIHSRSYLENNYSIMSDNEKDETLYEICIYFLTKTLSFEPFYFGSNSKYECTYTEMLEILSLVKKIEHDSTKYSVIKLMLDIVREHRGEQLTQERRHDLCKEISEVVSISFESDDFIKHSGFKILSEYYIWLTFKSFTKDKVNDFLNEIDRIPNNSDKVFCMTIVASEMRPKYSSFRDEILDRAEILIDSLGSTSEKILRLEEMAEAVHNKRDSKEKYYIKKALDLIDRNSEENDENVKIEKRLIDLAHQLDPEFATSIISSIPDCNEEKQQKLKKQLSYLELNDKVINDKGTEDFTQLDYNSALKFCNVCWKSYGQQLSRSIRPRKPEQLLNYIKIANRLPIDKSFPIYSWFIENVNTKYKGKQSAYFEAVYTACRFALLSKQIAEDNEAQMEEYYSEETESISILTGMKPQAVKFITSKLKIDNPERIIICDPYFDKEDLHFIYSLYEEFENEDLEFFILTSDKQLRNNDQGSNYKTEFLDYWKEKISLEKPPYINVFVANVDSTNESPFHDRCIITEHKGVVLGGSINGLGGSKEINILAVSEETRLSREEYVYHYFNNDHRYFRENKLDVSIQTFNI
ncbi:hypothetical protein [Enterococcus gallinarum]|uniref:hypothetical protein n=3 Tax=Enterococcus gallinarum TaxID=1353 RepID=UPI00214D008A|nr:hypothetical protein [Enterococcus gallinarum]MCR1944212.1 hypothetical protein [Enterococcus gallinarum]